MKIISLYTKAKNIPATAPAIAIAIPSER